MIWIFLILLLGGVVCFYFEYDIRSKRIEQRIKVLEQEAAKQKMFGFPSSTSLKEDS